MGICVSPKSPDIVFMEKDLDINNLIKSNLESQANHRELFDIMQIKENDKYELITFMTNSRIV